MEQNISELNHLVRTTLELEQYQCCMCKRLWYINTDDIEDELCLDFGCPWGCDDAGKRIRNLKTEINEVKEENKMIDESKKDKCSLCGNIKEKIDNGLACLKCGYFDE